MTPLLEMEATAEQIAKELPERLAEFAGQRFHVVVTPAEAEKATETPRKKTITEIVVEMGLEAPEEERAKIPPDLTDNLDHYIYGWPKKRSESLPTPSTGWVLLCRKTRGIAAL